MDIRNLRRSKTSSQVLLPNLVTAETYWNAFHIAVFTGKIKVAKFFFEDCRIDAACTGRLSDDKFNSDRMKNPEYEAFPLFLAIESDNIEIFKYLWEDNGFFWNEKHWMIAIDCVESKGRENFIKLLFESKTSHEIFQFLDFNDKIKAMEFFTKENRKYRDKYIECVKVSPYRWTYAVNSAKKAENLDKKEIEEIKEISKQITQKEIEVSKDERIDHVDTFMKKMTKLEGNEDPGFKAYKSLTSKVVDMPKYEKYKAEEDGDRLLTVISEDEHKEEDSKDDDSDSDEAKSESYFYPNAHAF
jgi:hypothetical protein